MFKKSLYITLLTLCATPLLSAQVAKIQTATADGGLSMVTLTGVNFCNSPQLFFAGTKLAITVHTATSITASLLDGTLPAKPPSKGNKLLSEFPLRWTEIGI